MEPLPPQDSHARLWLAAAMTGVGVGLISVAFHGGLDQALAARVRLGELLAPFGLAGLGALMLVCASAVALAVWLTARFAPLAAGSGIQHVEGIEKGLVGRWSFAVLWVKFVGGVLGIGGGLVLGREGPTVQMGATLADRVGLRLGLSDDSRKLLLAIGAGAGLAGAFNAPLAGVIFVAEELRLPLRRALYLGTLLASLLTDMCCRLFLEPLAELPVAAAPLAAAFGSLAPAPIVGALAGALGALFNAGILHGLARVDRLRARVPGWLLGAAVGAVVGLVAWLVPSLPGGGVRYAELVLDGRVPVDAAFWLLPLSFVLTLVSYSIGAPGGIFAPLLVIGALFGQTLHTVWASFAQDPPGSLAMFAAAGMAGLFASIVRAPLTGIVLLMEMMDRGDLALPLIGASLAAEFVATALGGRPLYECLLERELEHALTPERESGTQGTPIDGP